MYKDLFEELFSSPEPSDCDPDSGDESEDTGNRWKWDPHAGMKPSCQHGHVSDDEVDLEVKLPYGADAKVNDAMVNLMWELDDDDPCCHGQTTMSDRVGDLGVRRSWARAQRWILESGCSQRGSWSRETSRDRVG